MLIQIATYGSGHQGAREGKLDRYIAGNDILSVVSFWLVRYCWHAYGNGRGSNENFERQWKWP